MATTAADARTTTDVAAEFGVDRRPLQQFGLERADELGVINVGTDTRVRLLWPPSAVEKLYAFRCSYPSGCDALAPTPSGRCGMHAAGGGGSEMRRCKLPSCGEEFGPVPASRINDGRGNYCSVEHRNEHYKETQADRLRGLNPAGANHHFAQLRQEIQSKGLVDTATGAAIAGLKPMWLRWRYRDRANLRLISGSSLLVWRPDVLEEIAHTRPGARRSEFMAAVWQRLCETEPERIGDWYRTRWPGHSKVFGRLAPQLASKAGTAVGRPGPTLDQRAKIIRLRGQLSQEAIARIAGVSRDQVKRVFAAHKVGRNPP